MSNHNHWLRLWHEMPSDPKFRTVAKISNRPVSEVIAIYLHYLVDASKNSRRGFKTISNEDVASALDLDIESVDAVELAMQKRMLDGDRLKGWESRQPLREDADDAIPASKRMKNMRDRKKVEQSPMTPELDLGDASAEKTAFEIENPSIRELLKDDPYYTQPVDKKKSTPAGRVCEALVAEGIAQCNNSNVNLIALIEAGATVDEFVDAARESVKNNKPYFNYAIKIVQRRREEVKKLDIHQGPMPNQTNDGLAINPADMRIFGEAAKNFKPIAIAEDGSIL